jgi:hypothetical protein
LPINITTTYSVGAQFRIGSAFLNFKLQNSQQNSPTDSRIWSTHVLNGTNLSGSDWFLLFNNDYIGWHSPISQNAAVNMNDPATLKKREPYYFINSRAEVTNTKLDDYNKTYVPQSLPGSAPTVKNYIPDSQNKYWYASYHQMEAGSWRMNYEGFVVADRATGLALAPSAKSISNATVDLRTSFPVTGRTMFWHAAGEITTVNDASLFIPSMDSSNLFVQSVADTTLGYNVTDPIVMLLYMGIENWSSDRTVDRFTNIRGENVKGTLEYHDRTAGVGLDWNARPGKMAVFARAKVMYHHDSSAMSNDFVARQLMFEVKTYF